MYPLSGPPRSAGLYLVKNRKTGHVYAGQTVDLGRRYNEWRSALATGVLRNRFVEDAIKSSDPDDWVFEVLLECPLAELKRAEEKLVAKLAAKLGPLCLNVPDAGVRKPGLTRRPACVALSEVVDENGAVMSQADIAERLGTTKDSVTKRLQRLRRLGQFKLSIKDLPARQEYAPKNSGPQKETPVS